jgi:hypothetical protein
LSKVAGVHTRGKRYYHHHVAESYRENGKVRTRRLINVSALPSHAIEALRQSLRTGKALVGVDGVQVRLGTPCAGPVWWPSCGPGNGRGCPGCWRD